MSTEVRNSVPRHRQPWADHAFLFSLTCVGGLYIILILAMLAADVSFTTPGHLWGALASREIRYAIKLSLVSCSITAILSLWIGVPIGYLMSRYDFSGKGLLDALLDIPIVLPPLVIGLSLLILFQTAPGKALEGMTRNHMGFLITFLLVPGVVGVCLFGLMRVWETVSHRTWGKALSYRLPVLGCVTVLLTLLLSPLGGIIEDYTQSRFSTGITYAIPSVILAQFAVACAFAVRTMRVTFDQITPRTEQVALTLGCSRSQAFWLVVLPQAQRGMITAGTMAWARALGEFGPILVFAGATRMRTEVLPTTVFLELSTGRLDAAVAVSLLMVAVAMVVLVIIRVFGIESQAR